MTYYVNNRKAAMDELVRSHMPIIFRIACRSAKNSGVDINDLVMTATEGLLIAINRWSFEKSDVNVGCRPRYCWIGAGLSWARVSGSRAAGR